MKHKIIPTVFAHNKKEFDERFEKLAKITHYLQIDFMDGKFVRGKSISIGDAPDCHEYWGKFEAHLMVRDPGKYIKELKEKGFKKVIFHYEAVKGKKEAEKIIKLIKKLKMKAWIALNPETGIDKILDLLGEIDGVLFMGVNPGKEGQKFISSVYEKIGELRRIDKKIMIQVDGGVNFGVALKLGALGVNFLNSGGFVAEAKNSKRVIKILRKNLRKGKNF